MKKKRLLIIFLVVMAFIIVVTNVWAGRWTGNTWTGDQGEQGYYFTGYTGPVLYGLFGGNIGSSVSGAATSSTGRTYGVFGANQSTEGGGVFGYAMNTNGITYGLYGRAESKDGYGVYSSGRAKVDGDLLVTGKIIQTEEKYKNLAKGLPDGNIEIIQWTGSRGENETQSRRAEFTEFGDFRKRNLVDGKWGAWDQFEWASKGVKPKFDNPYSWIGIRLTFPVDEYMDKIIIYTRPNPVDHILDAWLTIEYRDKSPYTLHLGEFTLGGTAKDVPIPEGAQRENITRILLKITDSVGGILNVGLAEIECWGMEMRRR